MNLETQFKVIFFSFIYGMFFMYTFNLLKKMNLKRKLIKYMFEFLFCILHISLFYFLLYKINYGILNYYIFIFLVLGGIFCKVFYYNDKNY